MLWRSAGVHCSIGLGVMGWADMLIKLGVPYNSDEALLLAEQVMQFINENAHKMSQELAEEKGAFPNWEKSIFYPNTKMRKRRAHMHSADGKHKHGLRRVALSGPAGVICA
jgi:ribonucleotide reductase alpha subunit